MATQKIRFDGKNADDKAASVLVDVIDGKLASMMTDVNGNPLSSHYNVATGEYVLNIHDADVHNSVINRYVHYHTATETTLSADSAPEDYIINVADTAGFAVDDYLHINTTSTEKTHPRITAIVAGTPGTFTLDRRLDIAHFTGDTITKSIINMETQIGTMANPIIYWAAPESGEVWHITRLLFEMTHGTAGDLGLFGNLPALTNGVLVRVRQDGAYATLTNWKRNGDMKTDMFDVVFDTRSGGTGNAGTSGRGTFKNAGSVLRLDGATSDRFEIWIQDDITTGTLNTFTMKIQGHPEE